MHADTPHDHLPNDVEALKALVFAERDARQSAETLAVSERATIPLKRDIDNMMR